MLAPTGEAREQRLRSHDCSDLIEIGRSAGRLLCVLYDSVRGGATHNHMHAQVLPVPNSGGSLPVATARAVRSSTRLLLNNSVEASVLEWPAACIRVRGGSIEQCGRVVHELCSACGAYSIAVHGFSAYVFPRSASGETSEELGGLLLTAAHLAGLCILHESRQYKAATASGGNGEALGEALIERALRGTRGSGEGEIEEPHALLERIFEFAVWREAPSSSF